MADSISKQINFERKKKKESEGSKDKPKPFPKNAPKRMRDAYNKKYGKKTGFLEMTVQFLKRATK